MSQVPSLLNTSNSQAFGEHSTLNDLDLDVFLKLLITELQNQDPLNPMDNTQMLEQIHQIRQIGATDKLTGTLDSVLLGQNISSSTNLIGQRVKAISDDNQSVAGTVSRVSIEGGKPKLHLDLTTKAAASIETGELEKGKYSYRIVWPGKDGLEGIELSGDEAIIMPSNDHTSIRIENLPITEGQKRIYRTDKTGQGDYQLVGIITDGSQATFHDKTSDDDRSQTRQTEPFRIDSILRQRSFKVSLQNVADIYDTST